MLLSKVYISWILNQWEPLLQSEWLEYCRKIVCDLGFPEGDMLVLVVTSI